MNMTEGKPSVLLLRFALPLTLGQGLQIGYSLADGVVVGRLLSVSAFAAVGASWWVYWTALSIVMGLSHGFGTLLAQYFGAGDALAFRRAAAQAVRLSVILGMALAVICFIGARPVLVLLHTPADILYEAAVYLRVLLAGLALAFLYNSLGAWLRSMGDGKTPVIAMAISSILNIVLDIVLAFPFGLAGIALATLVAQGAACVYCAVKLRTTNEFLPIPADYKRDKITEKALLALGLPLGLRDGVISLGGLAVQYAVNGYGAVFVAGVAAAKRLYGLMEIAGAAMEVAILVFVAQNYGAGKQERIQEGVTAGRRILLVSAAVLMVGTILSAHFLSALFITGEAEQTAAMLYTARMQLYAMAVGLPALYLLFLYRAALQGMGETVTPMLSGFAEMALRIIFVLVLPLVLGVWGVYLADSAGWLAAMLLLIFVYYRRIVRLKSRKALNKGANANES